MRLLDISCNGVEETGDDIKRLADTEPVGIIPTAFDMALRISSSLFNYAEHLHEDLTVFHNELFQLYNAADLNDDISLDDSVLRISSSRFTNSSSACLLELAAQKKRALLQQQLRDAETEAESVVETCRQVAETHRQQAQIRREAAEAEVCRQEAEAGVRRQDAEVRRKEAE